MANQKQSRNRGITGRARQRNIPIARLPERSYDARQRALHVLAAMRHDLKLSLTHAAKLQGVRPETVKKYFPSALKKANGKFQATKTDRYTTTLYVPGADGNEVPVKTRSSREREQLGQYLGDLGRYLGGNRKALSKWHGKKVAGIELVTDKRTLMAIEPALSDFSLYRSFNSGHA
ncbi:MAG TPA: hypothetical protein VKW06_22195 [Candidatus Angelobacter sp.]|nr:hypothetical protein [Candidatus Angelobacter sp.]